MTAIPITEGDDYTHYLRNRNDSNKEDDLQSIEDIVGIVLKRAHSCNFALTESTHHTTSERPSQIHGTTSQEQSASTVLDCSRIKTCNISESHSTRDY